MDYRRLPRSIPEEQGIPSAAIRAWLNEVQRSGLELHSFMLLRHGRVVSEGWWAPYKPEQPHMIFSLNKIFTSTAVGIAISEGRFALDDKVADFFPEYDRNRLDKRKASLTVRHLLTMSAGQEKPAMGVNFRRMNTSWVEHFLGLPIDHDPGTRFVYNGGASHMLAVIVQKAAGQTLREYLQPRLFGPLGIEGARWEIDPSGYNCGGFGLIVKTEDIAKLGQLYLQKGRWNGKAILTEDWVQQATSLQISNGDRPGHADAQMGYGYQFWLCRHGAYRGDGAHGQLCVVMPRQDAVLAVTAGDNRTGVLLDLVWEHLLPHMADEALPEDRLTQEELAGMLSGLRHAPPDFSAETGTASNVSVRISGKRFMMEENPFHIQAVSFEFEDRGCTFTLWDRKGMHRVVCGDGVYAEGETTVVCKDLHHECQLPVMKVAASGAWRGGAAYVMTWRFPETPFCDTLVCNFEGNSVIIVHTVNVNNGPHERPPIRGHAEAG